MITPADLALRIQLTCVKMRSNAEESGFLEIAEMTEPRIYGTDDPLSLLNVTGRLLGNEYVAPMDAYNLLIICQRTPSFSPLYWLRWNEDLPEPLDALQVWMKEWSDNS